MKRQLASYVDLSVHQPLNLKPVHESHSRPRGTRRLDSVRKQAPSAAVTEELLESLSEEGLSLLVIAANEFGAVRQGCSLQRDGAGDGRGEDRERKDRPKAGNRIIHHGHPGIERKLVSPLQHGHDESSLGPEVIPEHRLGGLSALGHLLDEAGVISASEHLHRRGQDGLTTQGGLGVRPSSAPRPHIRPRLARASTAARRLP